MVKPGDYVKIKVEGVDGKVRGIVTAVHVATEALDVTVGPEGFEPDTYRRYAPGRTSTSIVIQVQP